MGRRTTAHPRRVSSLPARPKPARHSVLLRKPPASAGGFLLLRTALMTGVGLFGHGSAGDPPHPVLNRALLGV